MHRNDYLIGRYVDKNEVARTNGKLFTKKQETDMLSQLTVWKKRDMIPGSKLILRIARDSNFILIK